MSNSTNRLIKPASQASFTRSTLILATSAVVAKLLGAFYRIPLTNILGAEGIGLYQLAFPVYALIITLSSGAIPTALASIIGNRLADNDHKSIAKIYRSAWTLMLVIGGAFALILPLLARPIAMAQGNANLQYAYYLLSPCILIVALSCCIKGYFQGKLNIYPTAISQIVEQSAKLVGGLVLSMILIKYSVFHAVLGAVGAILLSEVVCMLTLGIQYLADGKSRAKLPRAKASIGYYKILLRMTMPIVFVGLFFPFVQFADSLIVVNVLRATGATSASAIADYGVLSGSVNTLINMPVMIILSVATTIVPYVARKKAERSCRSLVCQVSKAVRLTNLLAIPATVGIALLSQSIIDTVYPSLPSAARSLAAGLMTLSSLTILLLVNMQLYAAVLQGLGRSKEAAYAMIVGALLKIILDIILIYYLGIAGAVWAAIIVYAIMLAANFYSYTRLLGRHRDIMGDVAGFAVNSVTMGLVITLLMQGMPQGFVSLVVGGIGGVAIYAFMTIYGLNAAKINLARPIINVRFCQPKICRDNIVR